LNAHTQPPRENPQDDVRLVGLRVPTVFVVWLVAILGMNLLATSMLAGALLMHLAAHR
jgi:hypothetical protein